jgi:hypothetical protein
MKKIFLSSIVALGFTSLAGNSAPVPWNGHYYEFVSAPSIEWPDARAAADSSQYNGLPGHLVTVTSESENIFVASLIDGIISYPGDPSTDSVLEAWIGAFQDPGDELDPGKGWTWVHGEGPIPPVSASSPYANWFTGEPNDWMGLKEEYMAMWGNDGYGNTIGSFNDEGGLWNITGYLVEYEAASVPESGSPAAFLGAGAFGLFVAGRLLTPKAAI